MDTCMGQVLYQGTKFDTRKNVKDNRYGKRPNRETGGICPYCKNFVIKKSSPKKCISCNADIYW